MFHPHNLKALTVHALALVAVLALSAATPARAQAADDPVPLLLGQGDGRFGAAVALAGDVAVIGAPLAGDANQGAAFVYRLGAAGWHLEQRLEPPTAATDAFFGGAVAVHGGRVAVGAWGAGRVYLFRHGAAAWDLEREFAPSGAGGADRFGAALQLGDGLLVVAAAREGREPERAGAVHLFRLEGEEWRAWHHLLPPEPVSGALFGSSLALADGRLAVGASRDAASEGASGAVYLYDLGDPSRPVERLTAPPGSGTHGFGGTLALAEDLLAVGTPGEDHGGRRSGPVFVYRLTGSSWKLAAQLAVDEGPAERFGTALALLEGAVVAALTTDNDEATGTVRLLLFRPDGDVWESVPTLLLTRDVATVRYAGVAAAGRLLVGVPAEAGDPSPGTDATNEQGDVEAGAVYLLEAPPTGR